MRVHRARGFVREAVPVLVDQDAVGIDEDHGFSHLRARVHRLRVVGAVLACWRRAGFQRHANAFALVVIAADSHRADVLAAKAYVAGHHLGVALEAAAGKQHPLGAQHVAHAVRTDRDDAIHFALLPSHQVDRSGPIPNLATQRECLRTQGFYQCQSSAHRRDARGVLRQQVDRLGAELHPQFF
ncbi:hypothetical protein D3C87_1094580 [compost metagenome]